MIPVRRTLVRAMLASALVVAVPAAHALDVPIDGRKLVLKRSSSGREKLTFVSRDPDVPFPPIGGADDPSSGTPGGVLVELFSTATAVRPQLTAPPGVGSPGWRVKVGATGAYVYANPTAPLGPSPVRKVSLKQGRVAKVVAASLDGLPLDAAQGSVAIRVTTGTLRSCARFQGAAVRRDQPGVFVATNALGAALADCSDASLVGGGGTTTSTTLGGPTTSSTTTPTTPPPSTTSTSLPSGTRVLDFTTVPGSGACGAIRDGGAAALRALACGGLDIGGGEATVPEGAIPDGATSRFLLTGCVGDVCALSPSTGSSGGIDCTDTGCRFGPPLPIPNGGLSTCVINAFAAPGGGTVDVALGTMDASVPLSARVFVTGNAAQPCPRCSASGQPGAPGTGTCTRGANLNGACQSTNSQGLSADCLPGGSDGSSDLGTLPVDLTPLATTTASESAGTGLFCPGQAPSNEGCFGEPACRSFELLGLPAGPLDAGGSPVLLASTFCIPATGNLLVDGAAGLPGPGAASLAGVLGTFEVSGNTTTSTSSSTTTSLPISTTTIVTTTSTTTSTLLPPLLPARVELASVAGTGDCGVVRGGGGAVLGPLACGDLALGGGASTLPPSPLPDGAVNQFQLGGCGLFLDCALLPTVAAGPGFDCTSTGCFFGPPVPIPNGGLSACAQSTFAAPGGGSTNLLTGASTVNVQLALHIHVTGNPAQPCPRCSAVGAPGAPGTGTCDRGARAGLSCDSVNSQGLSKDCQPGGADGSVDLGAINADLSPVTTGTATLANPAGLFCPAQANAGCFGDAACRSIQLTGVAPGLSLLAAATPLPATLVSTFCVPATGNALIDGSADLAGPAAISLPGLIRARL
jgi:hypothetical protein